MSLPASKVVANQKRRSELLKKLLTKFTAHEEMFAGNHETAGEELIKILLKTEKAAIERVIELSATLERGAGGLNRMRLASDSLANLQETISNIETDIATIMASEGKDWVNKWAPFAHSIGIQRHQITLSEAALLGFNVDQLKTILANFSEAEGTLLAVGQEQLIKLRNLVGESIVDRFRETAISAMSEGIPLVGPGDTFANRLIKDNILKELRVPLKTGGFRTITVETRAKAIARTEMTRIAAEAEVQKAKELGLEDHVFNRNPLDSKPDECHVATAASPMTLEELDTQFGRPPRHTNCQCTLIFGRPEWFV